jgi:hypothetical protein
VIRATIAIDGRTVGDLANGGFLIADVPAGHFHARFVVHLNINFTSRYDIEIPNRQV